jgi:ketol-acid reductoisomerase
MARFFSESEVNIDLIRQARVAVIGFGSQGHAHALNLRDSGVEVVVGLHDASKSRGRAEGFGFKVISVREACETAEVVMMCTPDVPMAGIYQRDVAPHLAEGKTLLFAHGFNIHYKLIEPKAGLNVGMVSPKGQGHGLRNQFELGAGLPALVANHQGASLPVSLSYAHALGCFRAVVVETTFREETEGDLFGEQAVLCGGLSGLLKAGFQTLVEAGYSPEIAYFECVHEMKLIVDLIYEQGIAQMHRSISDTAEWGDYISENAVIGEQSREAMKSILAKIQSGEFAHAWLEENKHGLAKMERFRNDERASEVERVGTELRARMPFLGGKGKPAS